MSMQSFVIHDEVNQQHTLVIGEETLLLDGVVAAITALEDNQVTITSSAGTVIFSYIAFSVAILGGHPSPSDVGHLLALYLSRWTALQTCITSLHRLQTCIGQIKAEVQPWLSIPLPPYQFDELTRRALDTFDGTEETTRMLARILDQTPETIIAWAGQIGKAFEGPSTDGLPESAAHRREEKSTQAIMEPTGTRWRWTQEQEKQLEEDFLSSPTKGVVACIREIAAQRGWPYYAVQAKSYEMKLPQRKRGSVQREAETSPEDHSSEQTTSNEASAG